METQKPKKTYNKKSKGDTQVAKKIHKMIEKCHKSVLKMIIESLQVTHSDNPNIHKLDDYLNTI